MDGLAVFIICNVEREGGRWQTLGCHLQHGSKAAPSRAESSTFAWDMAASPRASTAAPAPAAADWGDAGSAGRGTHARLQGEGTRRQGGRFPTDPSGVQYRNSKGDLSHPLAIGFRNEKNAVSSRFRKTLYEQLSARSGPRDGHDLVGQRDGLRQVEGT